MSKTLDAMLHHGAYYILADFGRQSSLTSMTRSLILDAIEVIAGADAKTALATDGIEFLHEHLPPEHIGALRDRVMHTLRPELFAFACELGREFLELRDEFYVDDYTILRINYPYAVALQAGDSAENPGIGRIDPNVRDMKNSTQTRDPVYDPKRYHKNTPPASWAHGPHKDTWTGHSRNGINLWWAISRVSEDNSMVFYPDTFGKAYQPDPRSLYLAEGYPMPRPSKMALHPGEMLVFNPELMHATHLNISDRTRIALSVRINPAQPRFDPNCFYAREFWHSSQDIEAGHPEKVRQFHRHENFEDPATLAPETPVNRLTYSPVKAWKDAQGRERIDVAILAAGTDKLLVELTDGQRVILLRQAGDWQGIQEMCPHLDVSLMDGHHCGGNIFCPAHGVTFDTHSGCSVSGLLKLKTYRIIIEQGGFVIEPAIS